MAIKRQPGDPRAVAQAPQSVDGVRNPPRRFGQFGLRTLLAAFGLLSIGLAFCTNFVDRAVRQREAVKTVRLNHGFVLYDFQVDEHGTQGDVRPPGPDWLRNLLGVDYLASVQSVIAFAPDDASVQVLDGFPQLRSLDLAADHLSDRGLSVLMRESQLRSLALWRASASDDGWRFLGTMARLESLRLVDVNLSDSALGQLPHLCRLRRLAIGSAHLTDSQCESVGRAATIQELSLLDCAEITDAGLQHLRGLSRLSELYVLGRTRVSVSGLNELQRVLPNLKRALLVPNLPNGDHLF